MITAHAFAALAALVLGLSQLVLIKAGLRHKVVGYLWLSLMAVVAISSFWISDFAWVGPFGPIHLLSVYTLFSLFFGLRAARARNFETHRQYMRSLVFVALIGAGLFTLLPGRIMNAVLFG
ncbi:DUF2306 domain-containing protein [uncultured Tateyamaria sp.]|uniref:DUF2306 domain-containing protein n=1 Tax=uncultured Tateyamaria sp. TaxID=455651 RepID=UPI002607C593|nr:DUF2306 domain-containing protein [uncultured Tateyamaria sp.]